MVEQAKQESERPSRRGRGYLVGMILTLGAASLWGSTYAAIKIDLLYYSAYEISMLRAVFAAVALICYFAISKKIFFYIPRDRVTLLLLVCASFFGATGFWTFLNLGVQLVDPDTSTFLVAMYPLIAVVFASVILKEKMTFARAFGVVLGIAGTFVIIGLGEGANFLGSNPPLGEIFSVLAAFSWAGYMITTKKLMGRKGGKTGNVLDAEYLSFTTFVFAIIPTALITLATGQISQLLEVTSTGLVTIIYLGVFASALAFVIFNVGMKLIGVSHAAVNQLLFPGVSVLVSYVLLGEIVNLTDVIGIVLIVTGILVAQFLKKS